MEIDINGKLIYSRSQLGKDPDIEEIVEITKWGHKVDSYEALITWNTNKRLFLSGQNVSPHVSVQCGRGRGAEDGHHGQEEYSGG